MVVTITEFNLLLISYWIKFWYVNVFPNYMNCDTFLWHDFDLHSGDETATYS
jgi:hypothetical protein